MDDETTKDDEISDITDIYSKLTLLEILLLNVYEEMLNSKPDPRAALENHRRDLIDSIMQTVTDVNDPLFDRILIFKQQMTKHAKRFFESIEKKRDR